ncbi:hypothetical protein PNOK_0600800 [Pyrrhoderma noxium]|uniref:Uncharacterized protein n=1 Tax=Pyrrhoderma noxium TaxID=2282107 RepID=A0A286UI71_9AGAM|nr:hypothetical protein PNOK_0600800 [Pyrrhoderma noxium]
MTKDKARVRVTMTSDMKLKRQFPGTEESPTDELTIRNGCKGWQLKGYKKGKTREFENRMFDSEEAENGNEYTWYTDEVGRWTNLGGIEALLGHAAAEQSRAGALEGVLSNEDNSSCSPALAHEPRYHTTVSSAGITGTSVYSGRFQLPGVADKLTSSIICVIVDLKRSVSTVIVHNESKFVLLCKHI